MARENLVRTLNVREKTGNLKINGFDRQFAEKIILFKRGSFSYVATLKGENLLPWSANSFLKGENLLLWGAISFF